VLSSMQSRLKVSSVGSLFARESLPVKGSPPPILGPAEELEPVYLEPPVYGSM